MANPKNRDILLAQLIERGSRIGAERISLGKKPEQSAWDGSVLPVKNYLQTDLNDHDSSEFVEWSPVAKAYFGKEPYWGVRLKLRAKNAFGAYILRDTFYFIRNDQIVMSKVWATNKLVYQRSPDDLYDPGFSSARNAEYCRNPARM